MSKLQRYMKDHLSYRIVLDEKLRSEHMYHVGPVRPGQGTGSHFKQVS